MEKRLIIYAAIVILCIIALGLGVYAQFFVDDGNQFKIIQNTVNKVEEKNSEEEQAVKEQFDSIFTNTLEYTSSTFNNSAVRRDSSKDLVFTNNQISKIEQGKYNLNINVPALNIVSPVAVSINNEIESTFVTKATDILVNSEASTEYTIYSIDYVAYINKNVLSLVIKSTLKEGNKPQRIMYLAYNYNLETATKISLNQFIEYKNTTEEALQNKINKEIKDIAQKYKDLNSVGLSMYTRNPDDRMYKLENTTNFFLGKDNNVYIIYAYGNFNYTSEKDIIIF